MKYEVDANICLTVESITINLDEIPNDPDDFDNVLCDLITLEVERYLKLLDIRGGLADPNGYIVESYCNEIVDKNQID